MIIVESTYVCARAGVWSTLPSPAPSWAHGADVRSAVDVVAGMTNWLSGCKSRRANKRRRQHVVNSSSNFVFRGKYKQLEVCPYHIQIVFDLSLIWFERQVLIAIIHLLLLLPLARKWLIPSSSSCCSCSCCCCCWRGDSVLGFRLQPEENLRPTRFALTASDCIWGSHSGRVSAVSKWESEWGMGMKMTLAFQLKLQKRLSSYADDVYWLYTHTHTHLQHTHTRPASKARTRACVCSYILILTWLFMFFQLW